MNRIKCILRSMSLITLVSLALPAPALDFNALLDDFKQSPKAQLAVAAVGIIGLTGFVKYMQSSPVKVQEESIKPLVEPSKPPVISIKPVQATSKNLASSLNREDLHLTPDSFKEKIFYLNTMYPPKQDQQKQEKDNSIQGKNECAFWTLYNTKAVCDLVEQNLPITKQAVYEKAVLLARENGLEQIKKDDDFVAAIAKQLPLTQFYCIQQQRNLESPIVSGHLGLNPDAYSFSAIAQEIENEPSTLRYFFILAGEHWSTAVVIKNNNERPYLLYMNSMNSPLEETHNVYFALSDLAQGIGILPATEEYQKAKKNRLADLAAIEKAKASQLELKKRQEAQQKISKETSRLAFARMRQNARDKGAMILKKHKDAQNSAASGAANNRANLDSSSRQAQEAPVVTILPLEASVPAVLHQPIPQEPSAPLNFNPGTNSHVSPPQAPASVAAPPAPSSNASSPAATPPPVSAPPTPYRSATNSPEASTATSSPAAASPVDPLAPTNPNSASSTPPPFSSANSSPATILGGLPASSKAQPESSAPTLQIASVGGLSAASMPSNPEQHEQQQSKMHFNPQESSSIPVPPFAKTTPSVPSLQDQKNSAETPHLKITLSNIPNNQAHLGDEPTVSLVDEKKVNEEQDKKQKAQPFFKLISENDSSIKNLTKEIDNLAEKVNKLSSGINTGVFLINPKETSELHEEYKNLLVQLFSVYVEQPKLGTDIENQFTKNFKDLNIPAKGAYQALEELSKQKNLREKSTKYLRDLTNEGKTKATPNSTEQRKWRQLEYIFTTDRMRQNYDRYIDNQPAECISLKMHEELSEKLFGINRIIQEKKENDEKSEKALKSYIASSKPISSESVSVVGQVATKIHSHATAAIDMVKHYAPIALSKLASWWQGTRGLPSNLEEAVYIDEENDDF